MGKTYFVTATDTGAGKTVVTRGKRAYSGCCRKLLDDMHQQ